MTDDWFIDELTHAGHEHLDAGFVAAYDRKQGHPDAAEDIAAFTEAGLGRQSVVADFGAGTGQFAIPAARVFGRVVAIDVSPAMLAHLEDRCATEGIATVEFVRRGFLSIDPQYGPFDGIFTRNALHQLPDFFKALAVARMADLLRVGGIMRIRDLVYDFDPAGASAAMEAWLAGAVEDPATGYTRADLTEHVRMEHSTYRWLFEPMLERAGLAIESVHYRRGVYATYTCTRRA